jgi:hypothetical protein
MVEEERLDRQLDWSVRLEQLTYHPRLVVSVVTELRLRRWTRLRDGHSINVFEVAGRRLDVVRYCSPHSSQYPC